MLELLMATSLRCEYVGLRRNSLFKLRYHYATVSIITLDDNASLDEIEPV
jgi:hypothetical protein